MGIKLKIWNESLEFKGFKISRTKIENVECIFSSKESTRNETVSIIEKYMRTLLIVLGLASRSGGVLLSAM